MSKTIEQEFSKVIKTGNEINITARNYKTHLIRFIGNLWEIETSNLRDVAKFLTETADKIDADPDFKKPS